MVSPRFRASPMPTLSPLAGLTAAYPPARFARVWLGILGLPPSYVHSTPLPRQEIQRPRVLTCAPPAPLST
jgi:hypothetical protein